MSDMLAGVRREAEGLERQLRNDSRYVKLQALRRVISLYDRESAHTPPSSSPDVEGDVVAAAVYSPRLAEQSVELVDFQGDGSSRFGRAPNPERVKALERAAEFIKGRAEPTKTSEILAMLEAEGISVGGSVPLGNLSAMLSRAKSFQAHGRNGWTYTG